MRIKAFIDLWKHRYRKYSYIFMEHILAKKDIAHFEKVKKQTQKKLVAIVRTEHFGDIVAAEPIARQVRQLHPDAHIIWIVRTVFAELVLRHPDIDEVWQQPTVLRRILVCESGVFDKVYNLEFWQSNHDKISGRTHQNPVAERKNITVFNYLEKGNLLSTFQQVADLPVQDDTPKIYTNSAEKHFVDSLQLPAKFVVVHCNSNYPVKDWSVQKWEKLINWLITQKDYAAVEVGLKSHNIIDNQQYTNLCGKLSILQTAEVIRRADYFIGIDSGPAHLANAVGTYGILLFGKLDHFENYTIYSGNYLHASHATIISQAGKTCADMDYDFVESTIENLLTLRANPTLIEEKISL